jgi:Raf kinase inhibitor-like YbhB/YbcL family protein
MSSGLELSIQCSEVEVASLPSKPSAKNRKTIRAQQLRRLSIQLNFGVLEQGVELQTKTKTKFFLRWSIAMNLTSPGFENGANIPRHYTGMGSDQSPPLVWSDVPEGTQSFALICEDPDAPTRAHPRPEGPWVHWVLYNIPASERQLPEALKSHIELELPAGSVQGRNDFGSPGDVGYRGPMPPQGSGPHRYFFRIYALDGRLDLPPKDANKASLLAAMRGRVLAEAELMALFERK